MRFNLTEGVGSTLPSWWLIELDSGENMHFHTESIGCRARRRLTAGLVVIAASTSALAQNLEVVGISPASNTLVAPVDAGVTITFDQPVDRATVTDRSFWAFGRWSGRVAGSFSFADGDRAVTLVPDQPFSAGETVMVILSHDLASATGEPMRQAGYSYLFWTRAQPAGLGLEPVQTLSTRSNPNNRTRAYGALATDLNGDRFLDLTTINEDSADLRVFINKGDGTCELHDFSGPYAVNRRASPNEPSDFNHDGFADVCVANISTNTISVVLGRGDGTFQPQTQYNVGSAPRGIAVLDVNGDGHIDIVNTNSSSSNLSVLVNRGDGTFASPVYFEGGGSGEYGLGAADMNSDGILDLVASTVNSSRMVVLTGNGDGTFTQASSQSSGGYTWMIALGDLNGDEHADVVGVNAFSPGAGVALMGDGAGNLSPATSYITDEFPLATDLGDLDGDGDLDWINASFSGDWSLFLNDGSGAFTFMREFAASAAASCAVMFDADNDGDLDLGLIDELDDTVQIFRNADPPAGLRLDLVGGCPATVLVSVSNGAPRSRVALLYAESQGQARIPGGLPCAGTQLGLDATARRLAVLRFDAQGIASVQGEASSQTCGRFLQAVGLDGCTTSNVLTIR